jgi:hypothetical protein
MPYPAGSSPVGLAVADIDGDGHLDLAVANDGTDGVSLLFGDGLGTFSEPLPVAVARFPVGVLLRDLNGDGKPDLVVSTQFNGGMGSNSVRVLRNLGNRAFELQPALFIPAQGQIAPPHLAAGDLDGDRRADLVIGDITSSFDGGDRTRVFLNSAVYPARRADFNGDRRSDILWRHLASGENYAYLMDEKNIAGEGYLRTVDDQAWKVVGVGDFDGDRKADVLWRNSATGANYLYLMDGVSIVNEGYLRTVADLNWRVAGIGDFDGDGRDDILWRNSSTGENYVYLLNGLSIVNDGYLRTVADQAWEIAGVGDFDGDEKADILWRHATSGENYLYLMSDLSIVNESYLRAVADTDWRVAAVADFDGDGSADILWRHSGSGANYLYFMHGFAIKQGEGYLRSVADPAWRIVATGDYDGDGRADILWRNGTSGQNYFFPMDGTTVLAGEGYLRTVADQQWRVIGVVDYEDEVSGPLAASIYAIKSGAVAAGTLVQVQGAVVTGSKQGNGFFIQVRESDPAYGGASNSGVFVFSTTASVLVGDRVNVVGNVQLALGQITIAATAAPVVTFAGDLLPTPVLAAPANIATGGSQATLLEGVLVRVANVVVTARNTQFNEFTVTGGLVVDDYFYYADPPINTSFSSIYGILAYRINGTKLLPRSAADLSF